MYLRVHALCASLMVIILSNLTLVYGGDAAPVGPKCPLQHGNWQFLPDVSDEFDGGAVDTRKWSVIKNSVCLRTRYTDKNVTVSDGKLQIQIEKKKSDNAEYASGMLRTLAATRYGYYEAKIKMASCYACNAFWLYVSNRLGCGWNEIDIIEGHPARRCRERPEAVVRNMFADTLWTETPIHAKTISPNAHGGVPHEPDCDLDKAYHTYGLEWDEQSLKIYFDGKCVSTYSNKHCHEPLWLAFNLTAYLAYKGQPLDGDLPANMEIEYLRAWNRTDLENSKRIWTYEFRLPDSAAAKPVYLIPEADGGGRLKVYIKDGKSHRLGLDYVNEDYFAKQTAETISTKVRLRAKDNRAVVFTFDWKRGKGDASHSGYVADAVRLDPEVKLAPRESEDYVFLAEGGKEVVLKITHRR